MNKIEIKPMPAGIGVGFMSMTEQPVLGKGFHYEKVGIHHNYHVTKDGWEWPIEPTKYKLHCYTIDGFSPNLNKELHVGHLRNLATAASLYNILGRQPKMVALLGASLGVWEGARESFRQWCQFVHYIPEEHIDVLVPMQRSVTLRPGTDNYEGTMVWDGPKGPVVMLESKSKRPTYAFHDLNFSLTVKPDYYITGSEQSDHFASMGFADKHLPMGLILDAETGKKLKSRTGDAMLASEAMKLVEDNLKEDTKDKSKLAWNVLAWNLLHSGRAKSVEFNPKEWTKPDAPGLYITYTYARVMSALLKIPDFNERFRAGWERHKPIPAPFYDEITDVDVALMGQADYYFFYLREAQEKMDSAPLANFALSLSRTMGNLYHKERIADGRVGFQYAMMHAVSRLIQTMDRLTMFLLDKV